MKFLIWLIIGLAVVTWITRVKSALSNAKRDSRQNARGDAAETMLQCARCGIHVPASEAIIDAAGVAFCSEEHRAQRDVR